MMPAMPAKFAQLRASLHTSLNTFWQQRTPRERQILRLGGVFFLLLLVYLLFFNPALNARTQLNRTLPVLRLQAAQLQGLSAQVTQLGKAQNPALSLTRENINAVLLRHDLKADNVVLSGDQLKIGLNKVSFAALLNLQDELQRSAHLVVEEARIDALDTPDMVNATLSLRLQGEAAQ